MFRSGLFQNSDNRQLATRVLRTIKACIVVNYEVYHWPFNTSIRWLISSPKCLLYHVRLFLINAWMYHPKASLSLACDLSSSSLRNALALVIWGSLFSTGHYSTSSSAERIHEIILAGKCTVNEALYARTTHTGTAFLAASSVLTFF